MFWNNETGSAASIVWPLDQMVDTLPLEAYLNIMWTASLLI